MSMKRILSVATIATMAVALGACSGDGAGGQTSTPPDGGGSAGESKTVGVAMPEQTLERWQADGAAVTQGLEAAGYAVDLQFAGNDIPTQQEQIDQMITKGVDVLILASIDGASLSTQLDAAQANDIPVIAYDRLLTGSPNVDFYVTFDNFAVGQQQGTSLLTGLGVLDAEGEATGEEGPFLVELFAGSPDDNNAKFFFDGAMSVLQPYIDSGVLDVASGQTDFGQVAIQGWDQAKAQSRMDDLLTSTYQQEQIQGILAANDALARGAITALQGGGYELDDIPVVTGQDAELASARWIAEGWQYSSIFKDTRKLADTAVESATVLLEGGEPEPNDTETYDNGMKIVPSYLLESDVVTAENLSSLLVDSGYYSQSEVDSGSSD